MHFHTNSCSHGLTAGLVLVITPNPPQSAMEYFYDFIGSGRCEKFWSLEGKTVRYFGLKLQKLIERAAVASRSLEFGSARS